MPKYNKVWDFAGPFDCLPAQKSGEPSLHAEEEFEAIGLRNFFGNSVDETINWDKYFSIKDDRKDCILDASELTRLENERRQMLDIQMPSFVRGDEDEDAREIF
jgi:hypothetical protein